MKNPLNNTDVLVLCGGLGSRLGSMTKDTPKPMLPVQGGPFIKLLVDYIADFGFRRFILCAGYKSEIIENYLQIGFPSLSVLVSKEAVPLGTAGAIKNAENLIQSETFLVTNGDSFCRFDLKFFYEFHKKNGKMASIALIPKSPHVKPEEVGLVTISTESQITNFLEKGQSVPDGFVNSGLYYFNKSFLDFIPPQRSVSLEKETFPSLLKEGIAGFVTGGELVDIGTPDRYAKANREGAFR